METRSSIFRRLCAGIGITSLLSVAAFALETRTWTSLDGRTIEAELIRDDGQTVELKTKDGRRLNVKKGQLSQADQDYIKEYAPKSAIAGFAPEKKAKPGQIPVPAMEAKLDRKAWTKAAENFKIPGQEFFVLETPHFLVVHSNKIKPHDAAENAERMWLEVSFFHPTFAQKWQDKRMAIFIVDGQEEYDDIGEWYAQSLKTVAQNMNKAGQSEQAQRVEFAAQRIQGTWSKASANEVRLPQAIHEKYKVFGDAPVFRADIERQQKGKGTGGVWDAFRTHCIASSLLDAQLGGVAGWASEGYFALVKGFSYYKEIQLCGISRTVSLAFVNQSASGGGEAKTTTIFDPNSNWAEELKKVLKGRDKPKDNDMDKPKNGEKDKPANRPGNKSKEPKLEPTLETLWKVTQDTVDAPKAALAYSFSRYLQNTPEKLAKFAKLCELVETSNKLPDKKEIATLYGFDTVEALEADWNTYIMSSQFR